MASIFCDSFDPYNSLLLKWSGGFDAAYNTDPAFVRTGAQSMSPPVGLGFNSIPRINFSLRNTLIAGYAFYQGNLGGEMSFFFQNANGAQQCTLESNANGSIQVIDWSTNGTIIGTTAPNVLSAGKFYYIEVKVTTIQGGTMVLRVDGIVVLTATGNFAVNGLNGSDGFFLCSGGNYYDDFYLLDDTGGVNDDFLGPVQIFAIYPDENETPLEFTPLAGANFSEVNQNPPPDDAAYVFAGAPGSIDQYHYTVSGPTEAYEIKFVQHSLCCKLDAAGSHTVGSQINATTLNTCKVGNNTVGANYAYALFPWDLNPNTGAAFQPADFATTFVGPNITS